MWREVGVVVSAAGPVVGGWGGGCGMRWTTGPYEWKQRWTVDEVEVTVRMPRDVFDGAVKVTLNGGGAEFWRSRAEFDEHRFPYFAAHALFRAAMLEHTPPWEPTEEQVTAYCELLGLVRDDEWTRRQTKADLIAAHAVLCEGDR